MRSCSFLLQKYFLYVLLLIVSIPPKYAQCWYFELQNVDSQLIKDNYISMNLYFRGEASDNLETYFLAIKWDDSIVNYSGISYKDYDRDNGTSVPFDDYTLWNGEELPDGVSGNILRNINGAQNLDHPLEFFPIASNESLMAEVTFQAKVTGDYSDIAGFVLSESAELVAINGKTISETNLLISKNETSSIIGPIYCLISELIDQKTNIGLTTKPILFTITPTSSGQMNLSATSSETGLLPDASIEIWTDDQGGLLSNPLDVTGGTEVTLYLVATPADSQTGSTTITVTAANHADATRTATTDFDLTVELAEATLDSHDGDSGTTYSNASSVTFSGKKAAGSVILLKTGAGDPVPIVGAEVDGDWSYNWTPPTDGTYDYSLINQAGSVQAMFAEGTMVVDTVPPEIGVSERIVTSVGYDRSDTDAHTIYIRATAPDHADSDRFIFCLDSEKTGVARSYGETGHLTVSDGVNHDAVPIAVDQAGNAQAACSGYPVTWIMEADHSKIEDLQISLVEPEAEAAYVEIKWSTASSAGGDVKIWAKSSADADYAELAGQAVQDAYGYWWVFEDTATPAAIRSYILTDASGTDVLVDFERLDDTGGDEPVDPGDTNTGDSGDGGGGGGCFLSTIRF